MRQIPLRSTILAIFAFVTGAHAQTTSVTLPNGRILHIDRSSALGIEQAITSLRRAIESQAQADRFDADRRLRKLLEELRNQQSLSEANRILAETTTPPKQTDAEIKAAGKRSVERRAAEYARKRAAGEKTGSIFFGTHEEALEISKKNVAADAAREKREMAQGTPWAASVQRARAELEKIEREDRPNDLNDPRWKEWSARAQRKTMELCDSLGDGTTVFRLEEEVRQKILEEKIDREVAVAEQAGLNPKDYVTGKYPTGHPFYDRSRLAKDLKEIK